MRSLLTCLLAGCFVMCVCSTLALGAADAEKKKVLFIAGGPSHGFGAHDHLAGCNLLANKLKEAKPGYETLVTQVFVKGDPVIEDDAVFTASRNMIGDFRKEGDHFLLAYDFPLKPGVSIMPKAPVP